MLILDDNSIVFNIQVRLVGVLFYVA